VRKNQLPFFQKRGGAQLGKEKGGQNHLKKDKNNTVGKRKERGTAFEYFFQKKIWGEEKRKVRKKKKKKKKKKDVVKKKKGSSRTKREKSHTVNRKGRIRYSEESDFEIKKDGRTCGGGTRDSIPSGKRGRLVGVGLKKNSCFGKKWD